MPSSGTAVAELMTTRKRVEDDDPEKRRRNSLAALATLFTNMEGTSDAMGSQGVSWLGQACRACCIYTTHLPPPAIFMHICHCLRQIEPLSWEQKLAPAPRIYV